MKHVYILWLTVLAQVFGGNNVVDKSSVFEGESFTISCGPSYVNESIPDGQFIHMCIYRANKQPQDENCHTTCNITDRALEANCRITIKHARMDHQDEYICNLDVKMGRTNIIKYRGSSTLMVIKYETTTASESTSISTFLIPETRHENIKTTDPQGD